jgi:hypothetical protein
MDFVELILIVFDAGGGTGVVMGLIRLRRAKKCGADHGDPNLRSQPRLPGSVVGESSMGQVGKGDKITEDIGRW